jgi:hypothetical protein
MDIKNFSPKIAKLISDFENQDTIIHSHEENDLAALELIYQIGLLRYNLVESSEIEKSNFKNWLIAKMKELDTNDPSSAHGEKVIRRIGQNKIGEGSKYIEELIKLADCEFKKKQKKIAQKTRRNNPLYDLLEKIIQQNPSLSTEKTYLKLVSDARKAKILMPPDEDEILDFCSELLKPLKVKTVKGWVYKLKKINPSSQAR